MAVKPYELTVRLKGSSQREVDRIAVEIAERYWPKASVIVAYGNSKYGIVKADG
jgi:hypothetical protein